MISTSHVERFLEREQQDARQWLRDGMDQLVDQMFGQLRCKFIYSLKESEFSSVILANEDQILSSMDGFSTTLLDHDVNTRMDQQTFHDQLNHRQEPISEPIPELIPENNCYKKFTDAPELDQHLLHGHGIHRFRCALINCNRSFPESTNLVDHLREYHDNLTEFHCGFCSKHFTRYDQLHLHTAQHHHGGRFHCSYSNCNFVASFRDTVSRHYATHNNTALVCNFEGCGQRFKNSTFAKAHKRAHLGIEPYRCRWPGCWYAHAARSTAMNHIWRIHFKVPDDKRKNRDVGRRCGDPRDFLEVNRELL